MFAHQGEHQRQAAVLERAFGFRTHSQPQHARWQGEYVEYEWPVRQMVRPFGTPTLLDSSPGPVLGRWNGRPVSKLFHTGLGGLVFLGSALGVGLNSGEAQASTIVKAVLYSLPELKD